MSFDKEQFEKHGFAEISVEDGMATAVQYTAECSGSRSACCTRTCSADPTFVGTAADWDAFLEVKGHISLAFASESDGLIAIELAEVF